MFGPPKSLQGRYVIKRRLSQGRVGSVYQAVDSQEDGRPCAVKELTTVALLDPRDRQEAERRFLEEAAVWMSLNHPSLAGVTDAFSQARRVYLVMDLVEGTSLRALLEDQWKVFSEETVLHWAGQICDALGYLHRQTPPIVFGALTPSHVVIGSGGRVKLVDFGLTRLFMPTRAGSSRYTGSLRRAQDGARGYAAPEQRRQGQVSPRSDIYALGTLLYQLLTRHDPTDHPLPSLRRLAPDLSKSTERAIIRARKKDPAQRFPAMAEMRQALLGERPAPLPEVEPFVLMEGVQAWTVKELARVCAAHWDDGLMALTEGRITDWLRDSAEKLRAAGQSHAALELDAAAVHTESARQQVTSGDSLTRDGEIARQAAFAAWLEEMGVIDIQPNLEVKPGYLPFGTIEANMKARTTLRLRNRGQGYLIGRVESRVPWLTARPQTFGCRAGAVAEVTVEARGRRLPPGITSSPQVLLIESNGGRAWVGASAMAAAPILTVEPDRLDFGPLPRGAARVGRLTVTNRGGGRLSGTVTSQVPWLRVRNPEFGCPAGASAQIAVELLGPHVPPETTPDYKSGVSSSQVWDRVLAVDSDSGQTRVGVAWVWAEPSLELDVTSLDFGAVEWGASLERTLHIANRGTGMLEGRVTSQVDWLTIQPQALRCPPGESCTLNVVGDTVRLPGGDTYEESALTVETNAGREILSASVEVLAAELVIEPSSLDFGAVLAGEQVELSLTVGNRGSLPWQGQITAGVPWLSVEPEELICPPGHFIPASVILDGSLFAEGGEWLEEGAILIRGDGEERAVAAHVAVLLPRLSVEPRSLNFGLIGREDVATLGLTIANAGTGELHWEVENRGAWLEIEPTSGVCQPGQETTLAARAYALAVGGETDRAWLTVRSNGGQAEIFASVSLSSPVLMVDALELDLGTSENYAPVTQWLGISNRGVGPLRGTVTPQVPWLTVAPPAFECATGASLQVRVQAIPEGLRKGANDVAGALLVESNGGNEEIGVHLGVVLVPNLIVRPESLTFKSGGPFELELVLENDGYGAERVQVVPEASWLKVNRGKCTVKGGRTVRLKVRASGAEAGAESVIEVRADERTWRLPVRYE
jgi:serine/threonine-protein kinase